MGRALVKIFQIKRRIFLGTLSFHNTVQKGLRELFDEEEGLLFSFKITSLATLYQSLTE